jgi:signal transduction histidine kinase/ActR/RegA family two-component response regulator
LTISAQKLDQEARPIERGHQVRTASSIGLVVALLFAVFNIFVAHHTVLGLIELAACVLLVGPAVWLSRTPHWFSLAESLLLLASLVIFGALIVAGGVEGTGLFWVYTLPFLAFFLKGQKLGWVFSLAFLVGVALYFVWVEPMLQQAYVYSPVVRTQFVLSLGFYTLVAAAFNHVRSRYEAQMQQRQDEAVAAYQAKSRFLAAASHDLRQPAHALGMFVARLAALPQDPQTRLLVAGVEASVRALQDMLDSFFDYSRLDAPSMQVKPQDFAVEQLFAQLRTGFAEMSAAKGLRLRIRPSQRWLHSDPVLLQRVLLNLLNNAVQHTRQGSILVACRPCQDPTKARIEVWDSGIGIAPEHQELVFDEFFQVDNRERDRTKGLGLGLSIVQRSCQLLGHPLTMSSRIGGGTRFVLTVQQVARPVVAADAVGGEVLVADMPQSAELTGLRVFLIEDDALGSQALRGLLESWGCRVAVADGAASAGELLQPGETPDFVVSDYRLRGGQDGIEAIALLRQATGRADLPACVISGDTDAAVRERVQAAGLVLLQKPVRAGKLRSVLRRQGRNWLEGAGRQQDL